MKGSVVERIVAALFLVFTFVALFAVRIVYGLFFEGTPYTLPHFLSALSVTLVFIGVGGLLLLLGAWPFCRPHLREQSPTPTGHWSQEGRSRTGGAGASDDPFGGRSRRRDTDGNSQVLMRRSSTFTTGCQATDWNPPSS
jgi:hypothetical protein